MTNTTQPRTAADIRRECEERAERIRFQLGRELAMTTEQAHLLWQFGDVMETAGVYSNYEDKEREVQTLIRHFPGLAAAMRAVWQHLEDTDYGNSSECGLGPLAREGGPCRDSAA